MSDLASLAGAPPPFDGAEVRARRAERMAAWRRRSTLILRLRRILPISIGAIVVFLTGWVIVEGVLTRLADVRGDAAYIHMTNARFYGRDGTGRPYVLGAAEASRVNGDIQQIRLVGPILAFGAGGPGESHISAKRGVYREDDRILRLSGDVVLRDPSNNVFTTDEAIVDTVHGTVIGKRNVTGQGPTGTINADNFVVYDQGKRIIFNGDVHSRFKQD